jgi:UDP-N-acetylmuramyl pentapeptide phosphotransferase/UDP-N-acetylglucosamine-1-phosphate transferase
MIVVISLLARGGLLLFKKRNLLDKPGNDLKNTRKPVPTLQGVFVYLITFVVLAMFYPDFFSSSLIQGFLAGGSLIVVVELFAELEYMGKLQRKIPPRLRFVVHMGAARLALRMSGISDYEFILFEQVFILPNRLLYVAFSFRAVFVINAVNWIDGIYSQGNGILTIGFFTIFALIQWVVLRHYTEFTNLETLLLVKQLALMLAAISLVYTVIEYKPLGLIRDVGTMFLAFGLAYLSVVG